MITRFTRLAALSLSLGFATMAHAATLGSDAAACNSGQGPAILVNVTGMKDNAGEVRLELYPANENDFLREDTALLAEGKVFRRVRIPPPPGNFAMCIKVPKPGRYALLLSHNRKGQDKFEFWSDGAGFPGNKHMGRSKPKVQNALIDVGPGITNTVIVVQYLRGLSGFGPLK